MLHQAVKNPVRVKKIGLRVWTLRDEVESVLRKRLGEGADKADVQALVGEHGNDREEGGGDGPVVIRQVRPPLPPERVHHGAVFISELQMDQIRFFSSAPFLEGQAVAVEFMIPKRFIVGADVLRCHRHSMGSRMVSPTRLSFRVVAEFTCQRRGERTLLRKLVASIASIDAGAGAGADANAGAGADANAGTDEDAGEGADGDADGGADGGGKDDVLEEAS